MLIGISGVVAQMKEIPLIKLSAREAIQDQQAHQPLTYPPVGVLMSLRKISMMQSKRIRALVLPYLI